MANVGVPDTTGLYRDASNRRKVTLLLVLSFLAQMLGRWDNKAHGTSGISSEFAKQVSNVNYVGWFIMWVVLSIAVDYNTTADLALAFAILVFLVAITRNGENAIRTIRAYMIGIDTPITDHSTEGSK